MTFNHIPRASQGDCPNGSNYFRCGGDQIATWSGCCSTDGCNSGGCPIDAEINISIAPGAPWPTFTSDIPKVTSDVGAPVTARISSLSTVTTPTATVDTTFLGTDSYTPTSTITAEILTRTLTATPSSVNSQPSEVAAGGLPQTAIAGISVGSTVMMLGILLIVFLLFRRRKHAKRMPSYSENLRDNYDDKSMSNNTQATGENNATDVFAPFGGRANSFESNKPPNSASPLAVLSTRSRQNVSSIVSNPSSPAGSSFVNPVSPQSTGVPLLKESAKYKDTIVEEKTDAPAQLDSEAYYELDSADTEKSNMAGLPVPSPPNTAIGLCHEANSDHPESLMPGSFPSPVHAAQRQKLTRVQSGDTSVVTVRNKGQPSRPGSYEQPSRLRATMNATEEDVKRNRHVNSWDRL